MTMQPTADFNPSRLARSLLRRSRQGALATLMAGSGDPYCSLVNVASHPDGSPILLISRLALHTKNILGDHQGVADAGRARRRRSPGGRPDHAGGPGRGGRRGRPVEILRRRYLSAHPSAEVFVDFKDFSFFRIRPIRRPSGRRVWADHRPQAGAVPDRYRRCRGAAGSRAGRGRAHERGSSRGDEPLRDETARRRKRRLALHRLRPRRAWTCRPARGRCGWISRSGSPAARANCARCWCRLAGEARAEELSVDASRH